MVGVYSPTLSPWLAWTSYGLSGISPLRFLGGVSSLPSTRSVPDTTQGSTNKRLHGEKKDGVRCNLIKAIRLNQVLFRLIYDCCGISFRPNFSYSGTHSLCLRCLRPPCIYSDVCIFSFSFEGLSDNMFFFLTELDSTGPP